MRFTVLKYVIYVLTDLKCFVKNHESQIEGKFKYSYHTYKFYNLRVTSAFDSKHFVLHPISPFFYGNQ